MDGARKRGGAYRQLHRVEGRWRCCAAALGKLQNASTTTIGGGLIVDENTTRDLQRWSDFVHTLEKTTTLGVLYSRAPRFLDTSLSLQGRVAIEGTLEEGSAYIVAVVVVCEGGFEVRQRLATPSEHCNCAEELAQSGGSERFSNCDCKHATHVGHHCCRGYCH